MEEQPIRRKDREISGQRLASCWFKVSTEC